jgi:hypothetical protein
VLYSLLIDTGPNRVSICILECNKHYYVLLLSPVSLLLFTLVYVLYSLLIDTGPNRVSICILECNKHYYVLLLSPTHVLSRSLLPAQFLRLTGCGSNLSPLTEGSCQLEELSYASGQSEEFKTKLSPLNIAVKTTIRGEEVRRCR